MITYVIKCKMHFLYTNVDLYDRVQNNWIQKYFVCTEVYHKLCILF